MARRQHSDGHRSDMTRSPVLAAGGTALVAASLPSTLLGRGSAGPASGDGRPPEGVIAKAGGTKPTFLPADGSTDPVAFSIAESLFWNEQMMEHAAFFVMLMPGAELAAERGQAEQFQKAFAGHLEKTRTASLDRTNYAAFNHETVELVKPYADWKHRMGEAQASGKLRSLVWFTFFEHTAREADRFTRRLDQFATGDTSTSMEEAAAFWTLIMGEHADFIAHLLDPEERALIAKAMQTGDAFHALHDKPTSTRSVVEKAVDDIIDFKTAAEKGISTGAIKSIIHPTLADHVRREAIRAADELRRAR